MNSLLKNAVFCAAALPLLCKLPYLVQTFKTSPIEKSGAYFWLALPFLAIASHLIFKFSAKFRKCESSEGLQKLCFSEWKASARVLFYALFGILLASWAALNFVYSVNAAGVILGIVIFAMALAWRFGWTAFYSQLPVFAIAIVASPSFLFWLNYYSGLGLERTFSFFEIKLGLSLAIFCAWNLFFIFAKKYPKPSSAAFVFCVFVAFLAISAKKGWSASGESLDLSNFQTQTRLQSGLSDSWDFRRLELSESDVRFFSSAREVERWAFASRFGTQVGLLSIRVGKASDIHPIGICMKTSGAEVKKTEQIFISVLGKNIQVNRLEVAISGRPYAVYSWFSNGEVSTGDFFKFRILSGGGGEWSHYQAMMPYAGDYNANLEDFKNFLENFSSPAQ